MVKSSEVIQVDIPVLIGCLPEVNQQARVQHNLVGSLSSYSIVCQLIQNSTKVKLSFSPLKSGKDSKVGIM